MVWGSFPDPEDNEDVSIETAREDTDVVGMS